MWRGLDTEFRREVVGCPLCGVITQGYGRVLVEVIDVTWAGAQCVFDGPNGTSGVWKRSATR